MTPDGKVDSIRSSIWWSGGRLLCATCVYRIKFLNRGEYCYTQNVHPCQKEWNLPGFAKEPVWKTEDNGLGFNVVECDHYRSFRDDPDVSAEIYRTWINSDDWKRIRKKKLIEEALQCEICGSAKNLAVHHITYEHLLEEDKHMDDLIVLCKNCHEKAHEHDIREKRERIEQEERKKRRYTDTELKEMAKINVQAALHVKRIFIQRRISMLSSSEDPDELVAMIELKKLLNSLSIETATKISAEEIETLAPREIIERLKT